MKKNIIIALAILVVGIVVGLLCRPKGCSHTTIVQRDTTIVYDTIVIEKPILVERTYYDSLYVAVRDTIRIKDSVFVAVPIEKKTYKGEDYLAEISGYKANLDYIEVYPKTKYITEIQKEIVRHRNRFAIGVEVGYSDCLHNYIYAEYERMLQNNIGVYLRFMHDIPYGVNGVSGGVKAQLGW